MIKTNSQSAGFEPARAEPNRFLVYRLNHSATTAYDNIILDMENYIVLLINNEKKYINIRSLKHFSIMLQVSGAELKANFWKLLIYSKGN